MLEITGDSHYTIVAIGTSQDLTGEVGVRSFDLNSIAGDATLEVGKSYTFGYRNAQHQVLEVEVSTVNGTQNVGAVPLTGFDDFSDKWSYGFANEIAIGTIFGTGGIALDTQGLDGRIYSAQLSTMIPASASVGMLSLAAVFATRRRR